MSSIHVLSSGPVLVSLLTDFEKSTVNGKTCNSSSCPGEWKKTDVIKNEHYVCCQYWQDGACKDLRAVGQEVSLD